MKTYLILLIISICSLAKAQKSDSTYTRYGFHRGLNVHLTELKSKRGVLNGEYKILSGKKVGAIGMYRNDKKVGRWQYFGAKDSIIQVYNYSTNKLEYNKLDQHITFTVNEPVKEGDIITPPAKIGSSVGYFLLTRYFKPPYIVQKGNGDFDLKYIFSLDENGKLIKYETEITSTSYHNLEEISLKRLEPEDFDFSPAQLNGNKVSSKIQINSFVRVGKRN